MANVNMKNILGRFKQRFDYIYFELIFFQFLQFIERLCHVLNIDAITADVGLDMSFDSLLGRADQLVKMEADALQDRKTHIYNLQRKLKSMKEQLESKDLHLDLLRKKVKRHWVV